MINDTITQLGKHKRNVLGQIDDLTKAVAALDEAIARVAKATGSIVEDEPLAKVVEATVGKTNGAKGNFSSAGLARIKAAQKLRWAKFNAAKAKAARK